MKDDLNNWSPPEGSDNPMRMVDGEWFNTENRLENECMAMGTHHWGKNKFADEAGVQGYHKCLHCYRIEPL